MSIIEDYKVLVKNGTEKILSNGGEWNKWLKFAGNGTITAVEFTKVKKEL